MILASHCALLIKISSSSVGVGLLCWRGGMWNGKAIGQSWDWSLLLGCWPSLAPGQASGRLGAQGPGLGSCTGPSLGEI